MQNEVRIMVVGGAGFIGSHLCEELIQASELKASVLCVDNFITGRYANIAHLLDFPSFHIEMADASSMEDMLPLICKFKPHIIINMSAIPSVIRSVKEPFRVLENNILSVLVLLEAMRLDGTIQLFIHISSSSVYGNRDGEARREDMTPSPVSPYGTSKLVDELIAMSYSTTFELPVVSLRLFNVFGERQSLNEYAAVIPSFISALLNGKRPKIYGDGNQSRDFTYVKNVTSAVRKLLAHFVTHGPQRIAGKVYNIATGRATSVNALFNMVRGIIAEELGRRDVLKIEPEHAPERPGDIRFSMADISKAKNDFGYLPEYSLEEGLRKTVQFFADRLTTTCCPGKMA